MFTLITLAIIIKRTVADTIQAFTNRYWPQQQLSATTSSATTSSATTSSAIDYLHLPRYFHPPGLGYATTKETKFDHLSKLYTVETSDINNQFVLSVYCPQNDKLASQFDIVACRTTRIIRLCAATHDYTTAIIEFDDGIDGGIFAATLTFLHGDIMIMINMTNTPVVGDIASINITDSPRVIMGDTPIHERGLREHIKEYFNQELVVLSAELPYHCNRDREYVFSVMSDNPIYAHFISKIEDVIAGIIQGNASYRDMITAHLKFLGSVDPIYVDLVNDIHSHAANVGIHTDLAIDLMDEPVVTLALSPWSRLPIIPILTREDRELYYSYSDGEIADGEIADGEIADSDTGDVAERDHTCWSY